jgi:hypothetical protein
VNWVVLDAAARSPGPIIRRWAFRGTCSRNWSAAARTCRTVAAGDLYRHRFADLIGTDHIFDTLRSARAICGQRVHAVPVPDPKKQRRSDTA